MSLINEALKKAQHQRSGPMDSPPMPGGGSGSGRGPQGMPKGTMILLIAAAVVVIVVSVVTTVYFLNRGPTEIAAERPPAIKLGPVTLPKPAANSSPVVIAPVVIQPPAITTPPPPPPAATTPAPGPASTAAAVPAAVAPAIAAPADSQPPTTTAATTPSADTTPPAPGPDAPLAERIADYVDKVRVMGIRTSESGSKVLMNDKVYRVNDVVNRSLGLKLTKIEPDSLTFTDANGATYVKNF